MASEIKVDTIVNAGGDNDTGIDLATNDNIKFNIAGSQKAIIESNGKLGIGTTSPDGALHVKGSSDHGRIVLESGGTSGSDNNMFMQFHNGGGTEIAQIEIAEGASNEGQIAFKTGGTTTAMTINKDGNVLIGTTTTSAATEPGVILKPDGGLHMNNSTTGGGISLILLYSSHSTTDQTKFEVTSEGNVKSRTNSYAGFSDERLKEQIVDASSQWDDIKAIEIKNFKFTSNLDDADNPKMLGVIAQQVEKVSPSLVEIDPKDDMKTVKYSLLYLKAVKALQEAMARIETLEAKVKELESK